MVALHDRVSVSNFRKLGDGRAVADARFARAGIYDYAGHELGRPDMKTVRVYRPADEVFHKDAMASFAHKAITNDHPPAMVDASNWTEYAKGTSGDEVVRDGGFVRVPMMLCDSALVADYEAGKKELSAGYDAEITFEVGNTPTGEHYDAVMRNIRGNHIAVVDKGRAGAECRIADADFEGVTDMNAVTLKTILVDGLPFEVNDKAEIIISKLTGQVADLKTQLETSTAAHATAIAAKDTELGTQAGVITDLQGKVLDAAALDKLVTERAALVTDAKTIVADLDVTGLDASAMRRAVVGKKLGDAAVTDKSDDYVQALFDGLLANAKQGDGNGGGGPLADAVGATLPSGQQQVGDAPKAYDEMRQNMADAWKSPEEKAAA